MGEHIDNRQNKRKKPQKDRDPAARLARTSFKQYLRDLDEELLEEDLNYDDQDDSNTES